MRWWDLIRLFPKLGEVLRGVLLTSLLVSFRKGPYEKVIV